MSGQALELCWEPGSRVRGGRPDGPSSPRRGRPLKSSRPPAALTAICVATGEPRALAPPHWRLVHCPPSPRTARRRGDDAEITSCIYVGT